MAAALSRQTHVRPGRLADTHYSHPPTMTSITHRVDTHNDRRVLGRDPRHCARSYIARRRNNQ